MSKSKSIYKSASKKIKVSLGDYPESILANFTNKVKDDLAIDAIRQEDYQGLEHILKYMEYCLNVLDEAVERLNVKAVQILSTHKSASSYNIVHFMNDYFVNSKLIDDVNLPSKEVKIFKILIDIKKYFSKIELEMLALVVSKTEFDKFCQDKKVNLTDPMYKDLDLSCYELDGLEPLLDTYQVTQPSVVDVILSRTYSSIINQSEARSSYERLLNLDPIAREMLTYLALDIQQGDTVKIHFSPNATSSYDNANNRISVETCFFEDKVHTFNSVLIHEIGHYFYDHLFRFNAMPFKFEGVKDMKALEEKLSGSKEADKYFDFSIGVRFLFDKDLHKFVYDYFDKIKVYENAARKPVYKAAELLEVNATDMDKYEYTNEYTEYFKQNSIIDIFYLSASNKYRNEVRSVSAKDLPGDILKSLMDIYNTYHSEVSDDVCVEHSPFELQQDICTEITPTSLIQWALKIFLPEVMEELQLTPTQVHFLERIADYINRDTHEFSSEVEDDEVSKYAELIVRYAELKAVNVEEDILDSFSGLVDFHHSQVSDLVEKKVAEHKELCDSHASQINATQLYPMCYKFVCISDL